MHSRKEQDWLYRLISPFTWAIFSISVFLVSFFFPPFTYEKYTSDPYYGYLNLNSALFTGLSLMAMLAGWWTFQKIAPPVRLDREIQSQSYAPVTMVDLAIGLILLMANIAFTVVVYRQGGFQQLMSINQSSEQAAAYFESIVEAADSNGLGSLMQLSAIVIPWFFWLRVQAVQSGSGTDKLLASGLFAVILISYAFPMFLLGRRNVILLPLFGVFLVWFLGQVKYGKANPVKFVTFLVTLGICAISLFMVIELVRIGFLSGEGGLNDMLTRFIGYLVAPYNLQGAMLDGALTFPGEGKGYYWMSWFWRAPVLQHIIVAEDVIGTIPPYGVEARCDALEANGFERHFTALPIFANSYVDFGWFGIFPFLFYGFAGAFTWKRFREGTVDGIVLYTMFAYSVLEWRANILFPAPYMGVAIVLLIVLGIGRWFLTASRHRQQLLHRPQAR